VARRCFSRPRSPPARTAAPSSPKRSRAPSSAARAPTATRNGLALAEAEPGAILCRQGADCDAKWARAREWVTAHSRWKLREDTAAVIATESPVDSLSPAFTIRRLARPEQPHGEAIVFAAGCSPERVQAFVDHVPRRGARWRKVAGPAPKHTECEPPVDRLEADFVHFVTAPAAR